jgi:hypothetical protein
MQTIDVGVAFHPRLANRNRKQGDGKNTAEDFRKRYLSELDKASAWTESNDTFIVLDFTNVKKLGPSFANEAFAYFTKYEKSISNIKSKIKFEHMSKVQEMILDTELNSGWGERK